MSLDPPSSEADLLSRAERLSGERLGDIAQGLGLSAPPDLKRHKGWVGQLIERALGASAGSRAAPDFEALGVELKTLPVDPSGRPYESTFVCTIDLREIGDQEWEGSRVKTKLERVLWVPVQGEPARPPGERRVGAPLLWSPSPSDLAALRFDWEELAGLIGRGRIDAIRGTLGQYLQVRPKARDASVTRRGLDDSGALFDTLPRGFYLRARFTHRILLEHFGLGR